MIRSNIGWLLLSCLVAVNLVNGTLLAILTPMWLGADEYTHYGYIKHLETHGSFPDQRNCRFSQELEASIYEADWWQLSGNTGKVGSGPERFYAHGFLQFADAGKCGLKCDESHSGLCSLALNYRFQRKAPEALGVYLSPLDIRGFDAVDLWLCGDGSGLQFELAIDTDVEHSHKFTVPLTFQGFRRVVAPFEAFSGDLLALRSAGAVLKLSISDVGAREKRLSGTVLVDDIGLESGGRSVLLTGFEEDELPLRDATRLNWAAHHPPLYYLLGVPIERALRDKPIFTRGFALRLYSLALSTFTIVLAALISRLLFRDDCPEWLLLPCLMVFSPGYSLHQSSINNDHLLILLYTLLLYLLLKWQDEPISSKKAIALGVICGLGMLTKMLFITAFAVVAIYFAINAREFGRAARSAAARYAVFLTSALAVCGWWFVRNLMVYGKLYITATTYLPSRVSPVEITFLDFFLSEKFIAWIGVGWLTLTTSRADLILVILLFALSGAGFVRALCLGFWRKQEIFGARLFRRFTLLFYAVTVHALAVFYVVSRGSMKVGQFRALHGRYFFEVYTAIAAIWALGVCKLLPEKASSKLLAAVVAILIALEVSNIYVTAITHWYPF
ncbi:MAG: hypothetical protein JW759_07515 [Candidatus Coatesbacteria bacterium]|nr:hypothetical protein [Candidatus Coatesbacteria bacterium]